MRTPQNPEKLTVTELAAIRKQLEDAIRICVEAEAAIKQKNLSELYVLYKSSFGKAMDTLRRVQESIYRSTTAAMQGRPLSPSSVSPRSVIRKTVNAEIRKTKSARKKKP
jgi:hypothetical protein